MKARPRLPPNANGGQWPPLQACGWRRRLHALLDFHHLRGDEDQQLGLVPGPTLLLEQIADDRQVGEERHLGDVVEVDSDFRELLKQPEVTAVVVSTDEHLHVDPVMAAVERKLPMLIEKPLATDLAESASVLAAIEKSGVDAVIGYTQRFRRRWLVAKEKVRTGALGDVTMVTSRAFMNRLVAIDNYKRTDNPAEISPKGFM